MASLLEAERLRKAIRDLHDCDSAWLETVRVREVFQGQVAWEGEVHVFDLIGHPAASRCYAWTDEGAKPRPRTYAVLHVPPIDSPAAAVRASIVRDFRKPAE